MWLDLSVFCDKERRLNHFKTVGFLSNGFNSFNILSTVDTNMRSLANIFNSVKDFSLENVVRILWDRILKKKLAVATLPFICSLSFFVSLTAYQFCPYLIRAAYFSPASFPLFRTGSAFFRLIFLFIQYISI